MQGCRVYHEKGSEGFEGYTSKEFFLYPRGHPEASGCATLQFLPELPG